MSAEVPSRPEVALAIATSLAELADRARQNGFDNLALQIEFAVGAADQAAATAVADVTRQAGTEMEVRRRP